jgi:ribosomal protein S8
MSHDIVSDTLNMMMNAKKAKKKEIVVRIYSKFLLNVLDIAKEHGYVEKYTLDEKGKTLKIIMGKLNNCNSIKPRFHATVEEIEKYIRRYLPARNFGIIIISTSSGLLTHEEAYAKKIGGSLVAYFY